MAPAQSKLARNPSIVLQNKAVTSSAAVLAAIVLARIVRKRLAEAALEAKEKRE